MTTSLTERAMLVTLRISCWEGRRKNKEVSDEVKIRKRSESDTGSWWTYCIPPKALKGVFVAMSQARTLNSRLTLPWNDAGIRILSADMFLEYTKKMRGLEEQFTKAVKIFLEDYTEIKARAKKRLGDLYVPENFPTVPEIKDKFQISVQVTPLPDASDFRVKLGDEQEKIIRRDIEARVNDIMRTAMKEIWGRLYKVVEQISTRLKDPEAIIRESLIGNATELCRLLPKLNVTNDKDLEKMRRDVVRKLTKRSTTELRTNKVERKETTKAAQDILDTMETFMGGAK